jgi:hypothetical protein
MAKNDPKRHKVQLIEIETSLCDGVEGEVSFLTLPPKRWLTICYLPSSLITFLVSLIDATGCTSKSIKGIHC